MPLSLFFLSPSLKAFIVSLLAISRSDARFLLWIFLFICYNKPRGPPKELRPPTLFSVVLHSVWRESGQVKQHTSAHDKRTCLEKKNNLHYNDWIETNFFKFQNQNVQLFIWIYFATGQTEKIKKWTVTSRRIEITPSKEVEEEQKVRPMSRLFIPSGRNGAKAVEPEGVSGPVSKTRRPQATAAPKVISHSTGQLGWWWLKRTPDFPARTRRVSSISRITSIDIIKSRRASFQIAAEASAAIQISWWPMTPSRLIRGTIYSCHPLYIITTKLAFVLQLRSTRIYEKKTKKQQKLRSAKNHARLLIISIQISLGKTDPKRNRYKVNTRTSYTHTHTLS